MSLPEGEKTKRPFMTLLKGKIKFNKLLKRYREKKKRCIKAEREEPGRRTWQFIRTLASLVHTFLLPIVFSFFSFFSSSSSSSSSSFILCRGLYLALLWFQEEDATKVVTYNNNTLPMVLLDEDPSLQNLDSYFEWLTLVAASWPDLSAGIVITE